jgi:hypothetical protein
MNEIKSKIKEKYPKIFGIVLQLRAPEYATEEDVRRILRHAFGSATVISIEELPTHTKDDSDTIEN